MALTVNQRAAVERTGQDVCVVAGPGSGKTLVLVERFAWLVEQKGISPLRILAFTFTEKAATQLKRRLAERFQSNEELRKQVERAYVSTVHGFCSRLLREHAIAAGLDPDFAVLDEAASAREMEEAADLALESLYQCRRDEFRKLLDALYVATHPRARRPDLARALCEIYQAARTAGIRTVDLRVSSGRDPEEGLSFRALTDGLRSILPAKPSPKQAEVVARLRAWTEKYASLADGPPGREHFEALAELQSVKLPLGVRIPGFRELRDESAARLVSNFIDQFYAPLKALLTEAMEMLDERYRSRKRELGGLDFSDLEECAIELLRNNTGLRASIQRSFDQILMDELQDTNPLQWRLIDLLRAEDNFFAVGDMNQSIFGFRHAEPKVYQGYHDSLRASGAEIDTLGENFRSRPEILRAVARVTATPLEGVQPGSLRAMRDFPPKPEPSVEVIVGYGDDKEEAARVEAYAVAGRIGELVGVLRIHDREGKPRPARFRDVAILVRKMNVLPPIQEALQDFGIPYLTEGGRTFYETREVLDLIQLLRAVANPEDEVALAGVMRSPLAGIGDDTLLRLKLAGKTLAAALLEGDESNLPGEDPEEAAKVKRFVRLLAELRPLAGLISPDRLLLRAMDACDYETGLSERQQSNVSKLLALLRERHESRPQPLAQIVADLDWLRQSGTEAEAPPEEVSDAVRILTIHKAKGLEFPVVFLPALDGDAGGSSGPIRLAPGGGLGVAWRNPASGREAKDPAYRAAEDAEKAKQEGEEHRLLYVAMTRAEEHLVLSFAEAPRAQGKFKKLILERLCPDLGGEPDAVARVTEAREGGLAIRVLRTSGFARPPLLSLVPQAAARETLLLPRPAVAGQHDSTATVTSIQLFAQCPRRYYLGRYLGWDWLADAQPSPGGEVFSEETDRDGLDAATFGTMVHDLLAGKPVAGATPEALELVRRFQESPLGMRAARAVRAEREYDFVFALEDVVLRGQIDLWFEEGGELILLDYKTDQVTGEAAESGARYGLQLRLYALALERLAGRRPDQAYVAWLRSGQAAPVSLDPQQMERAVMEVRRFKEAQSALRFDLKESEACATCPYYRGLCPAGRKS